jgi:O-antigen/teichoic acid export membrane protein
VIGVNQLFAQNIINMLERVSFTTLCAAVGDRERFKDVMHQSAVIQLTITAFAGAWMFAGCDNLILATIGPAWMDVPPLLKWLAITVPVSAIHITGYLALFAVGRIGLLAWLSVAEMVISVVLVYSLSGGGMGHVAIGWASARVLVGVGTYLVACRVAGAGVFSIVPTGLTLLAMAATAAAGMLMLQPRLEGQLATFVPAGAAEIVRNMVINGGALGLASLAAAGIYGSLLVLLQPELFARVKQLALRKRA